MMEEKIRRCVFQVLDDSAGVEGEDVYLVQVHLKGSARHRKIDVQLDSDTGIRIDQCAFFNRRLRARIENDTEPPLLSGEEFDLEVSSPGLGEPIVVARQYLRHTGRLLRVAFQADDGHERTITGRLSKVVGSGETITGLELTVPGAGRKRQADIGEQVVGIELEQVVRAVPEVEW